MTRIHGNFVRPRFGRDLAEKERTEQKLAAYEAGWKAIADWDRRAHSVPVLDAVRLPQLLEKARTFLSRQAAARYSDPVPFMIGMAGGTASGKTTIKDVWIRQFPRTAHRVAGWQASRNGPVIDQLELDNYYRDMSERRRTLGEAAFFRETNLDEPAAVSLDKATRDLLRLKNGQAVRVPRISFMDSRRRKGDGLKVPAPFFVTEGLFTLVNRSMRQLMDLTVFVAADYDTRKQRWWARAASRNIQPDEAGMAFFNRGMAMHDQHVEPTRAHADVVINSAAPLADVQATLRRITRLLVKTFYPTSG